MFVLLGLTRPLVFSIHLLSVVFCIPVYLILFIIVNFDIFPLISLSDTDSISELTLILKIILSDSLIWVIMSVSTFITADVQYLYNCSFWHKRSVFIIDTIWHLYISYLQICLFSRNNIELIEFICMSFPVSKVKRQEWPVNRYYTCWQIPVIQDSRLKCYTSRHSLAHLL